MLPPYPAWILGAALVAQGAYAPRADLDEGRYLKALGEAEARLKQNPREALAWATKAHALSALLRFPEALQASERALALDPNLADAYLARGLSRGGLAVQQRNLGSLGKASGALDDLRRATELDPGFAMAWTSLGLAYQQLPGLLGGSTRKALACATSLRGLRPARADALQGTILSLDGRWKEAEPCFRRALAAGASDPQVVAAYLEALGSRETRKALGEAAQRTLLAQEGPRWLPGVAHRAKGVEAVAEALLDGDRDEEAWKTAKEALPRVEAPSLLKYELGKIAAKGGIHLDEGLAYLDQVLREPLEGGSAGPAAAHWRRGQIFQRLGRTGEARSAAQSALALDPKHPGATRLLKDLS